MTKEISKQICEKCNLTYEVPHHYWVVKNPPFGTEAVQEVTQRYLDFGYSENFVRLLELPYLSSTLLDFMKEYPIKDRETFLEKLLYELDNNEELKQLIRKAEWECV